MSHNDTLAERDKLKQDLAAAESRCRELENKLKEWEDKARHLHCMYCGHDTVFIPGESKEKIQTFLVEHAMQCEKRPERKMAEKIFKLEKISDFLGGLADEQIETIESLKSKVAAARETLDKYGNHTSQCLENAVDNHFLEGNEPPCICGLTDALTLLGPKI